MPVQIICKFHEVSIEAKQAMFRTRSNMRFLGISLIIIFNLNILSIDLIENDEHYVYK